MGNLTKFQSKRGNALSKTRKSERPQSINLHVDSISFIKRIFGNQAMHGMMKSGVLQATPRIGQPNDIHEQEADCSADQIMRVSEPGIQLQPT